MKAKKLLAALLSVLMVLLMMPTAAFAEGEIKLFIGGQQITESGCYEKIKKEIGQRLAEQNLPAVSFIMTQTPSPLR